MPLFQNQEVTCWPRLPLFLSYSSFARKPPHALKGQKLLAQGIALGNYGRKLVALKGQKL